MSFTRIIFLIAVTPVAAAMSVTLDSSAPDGSVGTVVTWNASVSDAGTGTLWYRFRARAVGADFHTIVDYGPNNAFDWAASDHEGLYEIEASVRNLNTGEISTATANFSVQPQISGDEPQIQPTANAMVFLYSAPPCVTGSRMRVQFGGTGLLNQNTPWKPCDGLTMNFYLAGLRSDSIYTVHHTIDTGSSLIQGPNLELDTPPTRSDLAAQTVLQERSRPLPDGIVLQGTLFTNTLATDLNGNLIWYYPGTISFLTRPDAGGYFFGVVEDPRSDSSHQVVREFDVVGTTVLETNAARVAEQLMAMGKRPISGFHHEARRLRNGNILVLAGVEQILTDVQGPGRVDVLGDMIVVLDPNLQVVWTWDAFDHLDVTRPATLGDICSGGNCPPLYLAADANDWLHGNSVQETPDGNLLYSSRSQDWVIKIDYQNGGGTGDVIWRLGYGGDFQIISSDPSPWFSHQHDPEVQADNSTMSLLDNGNGRQANDPAAHSRGQVLVLDEQNRIATLAVNIDLGQYSFALGAAQWLPNGDYHFVVGFLPDGTSTSVEFDVSGNLQFALHADAPVYRSFRMRDLYTP
jgi:hypothetical protein